MLLVRWRKRRKRKKKHHFNVTTLLFCFRLSFSGVAVTSNGVNSLVGVAISASLLPPLVNAGLCLSFAYGADFMYDHGLCFSEQLCTSYVHKKTKFRDLAFNSVSLFLINIVFIFVFCILIFKIKGLPCCYKSAPRPWWNDLPRSTIDDYWGSKGIRSRKYDDVTSSKEERKVFSAVISSSSRTEAGRKYS